MKDIFEILDLTPEEYKEYKRAHGMHFSKELCEFAVGLMESEDKTGNRSHLTPMTKQEVDELLKEFNVEVRRAMEYDTVFVANMGKADYLGDSVPDREHLARYIKNVIDDPDGYDGIAFNRWFADMCAKKVEVPWERFL